MRVLPITNTNLKTQQNPAFQARIPKALVNQMLGETEPLTKLQITTAKGMIFSLPAAIVAKLSSINGIEKDFNEADLANMGYKTDKLFKVEDLEEFCSEEFLDIAGVQDEDGNTIFHKEKSPKLVKKLMETKDYQTIASILSKVNNGNKTAYELNHTTELKQAVIDTATSGELSINGSLDLLRRNSMYDLKLSGFLEARKEKFGANSAVNSDLVNELFEADSPMYGVDVRLDETVVFQDVPVNVAAKMFIPNAEQPEYATLDSEYLFKTANNKEISDILISAFDSESPETIVKIMKAANGQYAKILENIDLDINSSQHLNKLLDFLNGEEARKFFKRQDKDNMNIMHHAANKEDNGELYSELLSSMEHALLQMQDIHQIMLQKDADGYIPAALDDDAAIATIRFYGKKNEQNLLVDIVTRMNNNSGTLLHENDNLEIFKELFDVMRYRPELMSQIMVTKNDNNETIYNSLDKYLRKETKEFVKDKIIGLATDSDLPLKESIRLLEINELEPQLVEYLKLHLEG